METLLANKGAYKNYNAHFVPVVPKDTRHYKQAPALPPALNTPDCPYYYPCQSGELPVCDEVVVFQSAQTLPRYWIELQVEHPSLGNVSIDPKYVGDLIPHMYRILGHPEVDGDRKLRNVFSEALTKLLQLDPHDDLTDAQTGLFSAMKNLIDPAGKINKLLRQSLVGAAPAVASSPGGSSVGRAAPALPIAIPGLPAGIFTPEQIQALLAHLAAGGAMPASAAASAVPAQVQQVTALPELAFGAADWNKYFGDVGIAPPLPANINEILESECPIWPGVRVKNTHVLMLIPKTVNGKPFTLNALKKLVEHPKGGAEATTYGSYDHGIQELFGEIGVDESYWLLMTNDVFPNSRSKTYDNQEAELRRHRGYEVPKLIEAAAGALMEWMKTGKRLFSDSPLTYTRCKEKEDGKFPVVVGAFPLLVSTSTAARTVRTRCTALLGRGGFKFFVHCLEHCSFFFGLATYARRSLLEPNGARFSPTMPFLPNKSFSAPWKKAGAFFVLRHLRCLKLSNFSF